MIKRILIFIFLLIVSAGVQAQSDCERLLEAAMNYYNEGNYNSARKQLVLVQKECNDKHYGGADEYIKKCDAKIQEADFRNCTTIEACNNYLNKYPKGVHVSEVKEKLTKLMSEEDAVFEKCETEATCREYLKKYPHGRYVEQVKKKLDELVNTRLEQEEKSMFLKCETEAACKEYLKKYPRGRYVEQVKKKLDELVNTRLEQEEKSMFLKCETEAACKEYLKKYPHGRYVEQVNKKLAELENTRLEQEETSEFLKCSTESACLQYLAKYPNGRYADKVNERLLFYRSTTEDACEAYLAVYPNGKYVEQVTEKLDEFKRLRKEEYDAYKNCTTEEACIAYLEKYPDGKYSSEVKTKKDNLKAERLRKMEMEAAKTAYMKIVRIDFANTNQIGMTIDPFGSTLYASDIKYLKPMVIYDGILEELRDVSLYCKLYSPDGTMKSNESSPAGYTFYDSFTVYPGEGNTVLLTGWGNNSGGTYISGKYTLELWYEGKRIYQAYITIKERENDLSRGGWMDALRKCNRNATRTYSNGSYKGQIRSDSTRTGLGMFYWKDDESFYIGEWQSGKRWGVGIYIASSDNMVSNCPRCMYYVGEFRANKKHGEGTCYDKFGNLIYYGSFEDDVPTDDYPMAGRNNYKFECFEIQGGNYYIGETMNGKRNGEGIYIWENGNMWVGSWEKDEREGYGINIRYEGSYNTGTWENGVKQ